MNRHEFAALSLKRDQAYGVQPKGVILSTLPPDEHVAYLEEADLYLSLPREEWPTDVNYETGEILDDGRGLVKK